MLFSQTPAGWSCETPAVGSEGVVRCAAEEMLPGTETLSIVVFVAQPHGITLSNVAQVVSAALDATPTDNTITESTNVLVPVAINIRPGGYPNSVNLKSNVTVAILTTSAGEYGLPLAFNATTIDPLSVRFGLASVVLGGVEEHQRSTLPVTLKIRTSSTRTQRTGISTWSYTFGLPPLV